MYNDSERSDTSLPVERPDAMPTPIDPKVSRAAQTLGRRGGTAGTPAQKRARQQNALLAGRPGRTCKTCGQLVQSPSLAAHDQCGLWTWQPARSTHPKKGKRS